VLLSAWEATKLDFLGVRQSNAGGTHSTAPDRDETISEDRHLELHLSTML
jgi:hypothetical protein